MKRLDLIISAIEDALKDFKTDSYDNDFYGCCGADADVAHTADCKLTQALATARELRELKLVGVFEYDKENNVWEGLTPCCKGVRLYALGDEK
jgi:hypothetical protein